MSETAILTTFELFSLMQMPLTLIELHLFLLNHPHDIRETLDQRGEVTKEMPEDSLSYITMGELLELIKNLVSSGKLESHNGYYCLAGQKDLIIKRLESYSYGIIREKRLKRLLPLVKMIPFIRSIILTGSQNFGLQKKTSDIDLLIITDSNFFWLPRLLISGLLQVLGIRRHGKKIANRICLNHYLREPKKLERAGNIYTALEYLKMRPLFGKAVAKEFFRKNRKWIQNFFPHASFTLYGQVSQGSNSIIKKVLEKLFQNRFGHRLENWLKKILLARIHTEDDVVVMDNELLFHHDGKQYDLTRKFLNLPIFQTPKVIIEEIEIVDIEVRI
jgi:predicted nucleotidyltransferase